MPQIWMTYDEIAELMTCASGDARSYVHRNGLDRRRSRDGQTRAKLDRYLAERFMVAISLTAAPLAAEVAELRRLHAAMASRNEQKRLA